MDSMYGGMNRAIHYNDRREAMLREEAARERAYQESLRRQAIADARFEDHTQYSRGRDTIGDQRFEDQIKYGRGRDALSDKRYETDLESRTNEKKLDRDLRANELRERRAAIEDERVRRDLSDYRNDQREEFKYTQNRVYREQDSKQKYIDKIEQAIIALDKDRMEQITKIEKLDVNDKKKKQYIDDINTGIGNTRIKLETEKSKIQNMLNQIKEPEYEKPVGMQDIDAFGELARKHKEKTGENPYPGMRLGNYEVGGDVKSFEDLKKPGNLRRIK